MANPTVNPELAVELEKIRGSYLSEIRKLQARVAALERKDYTSLSLDMVANDVGSISEGIFVSPNEDSESSNPEEDTFSGVVQAGRKITSYDNVDMIWGAIKDGVAKVWIDPVNLSLNFSGVDIDTSGSTFTDAYLNLTGLGWITRQVATVGAYTRTMRMGMQDNGTYPEGRIEFYETGAALSITNADFASLDMTGWTQSVQGRAWAAFGTATIVASDMKIDSSGNIYICGISGGAPVVYKITSAGTTTNITATGLPASAGGIRLVLDSSGNPYVAMSSTSASNFYKYSGGTWSTYGTSQFNPTLASGSFSGAHMFNIDASNNLYAVNNADGDIYYCSGSGSAWTLTVADSYTVYSLYPNSTTDIYALTLSASTIRLRRLSGGSWSTQGTFPESSVYPQDMMKDGSGYYWCSISNGSSYGVYMWNGSAWASKGTLATGYSLAYLSGNMYMVSTGDVQKWVTSDWVSIGNAVVDNGDSRIVMDASSNLYVNDAAAVCVQKLGNENTAWSGSGGYAEVTNAMGSPEIKNSSRIAVTAGTNYLFTCNTWLNILSGSCTVTVVAKFYTASSGGSLVQTLTIGTRTVGGSSWIEISASTVCPATATHVEFVATLATTNGYQTVRFDDFSIASSNAESLVAKDDGLYEELDGVYTRLGMLLSDTTDVSVSGASTLTSSALGKWHVCSGTSYTITLPTAAGFTGYHIAFRVTASGIITLDGSGSETVCGYTTFPLFTNDTLIIKSNGSNWVLVNSSFSARQRVIFVDTANTTVVSSAAETNLWSTTLPAHMIGTDNLIKVSGIMSYLNNSSANRTLTVRFYYGSTSFTLFSEVYTTSATRRIISYTLYLKGNGATNSQLLIATAQFQSDSSTFGGLNILINEDSSSYAVDSTASQTLKITTQHSLSGANISVSNRIAAVEFYKNG